MSLMQKLPYGIHNDETRDIGLVYCLAPLFTAYSKQYNHIEAAPLIKRLLQISAGACL